MTPLNALDTWSIRSNGKPMQPQSRCFIVAEGANTEYWYLSHLATLLSKKGLPKRMELKPIERTEEDRNSSHPRKLYEQACIIREDEDGNFGFDKETDEVLIVFDADVYKGKPVEYAQDLKTFKQTAKVAVTYPSFELFLLLHADNAFEKYIEPHVEEIYANKYAEGHRRYIEKLASDVLGMNPKRNPKIASLAANFEVAAREELNLNQDPNCALDSLSSNVAMAINQIIDEHE